MKSLFVIVAVLGLVSFEANAQTRTPAAGTGFTPQELDRMSQQNLAAGAQRGFASGPPPRDTTAPVRLHQPSGLWVCKSTDPYVPILAEPRPDARPIGQSAGQVAAGADSGAYTSVLFHEGQIGYVPRSALRPYQNQFNPRASCRFGGLRPDGMVTFDIR